VVLAAVELPAKTTTRVKNVRVLRDRRNLYSTASLQELAFCP
jgi:hypothetical protein